MAQQDHTTPSWPGEPGSVRRHRILPPFVLLSGHDPGKHTNTNTKPKNPHLKNGRSKGQTNEAMCISNAFMRNHVGLKSVKSLYLIMVQKNQHKMTDPRPLLGCSLGKTVARLSNLSPVCGGCHSHSHVALSLVGKASTGDGRDARSF